MIASQPLELLTIFTDVMALQNTGKESKRNSSSCVRTQEKKAKEIVLVVQNTGKEIVLYMYMVRYCVTPG